MPRLVDDGRRGEGVVRRKVQGDDLARLHAVERRARIAPGLRDAPPRRHPAGIPSREVQVDGVDVAVGVRIVVAVVDLRVEGAHGLGEQGEDIVVVVAARMERGVVERVARNRQLAVRRATVVGGQVLVGERAPSPVDEGVERLERIALLEVEGGLVALRREGDTQGEHAGLALGRHAAAPEDGHVARAVGGGRGIVPRITLDGARHERWVGLVEVQRLGELQALVECAVRLVGLALRLGELAGRGGGGAGGREREGAGDQRRRDETAYVRGDDADRIEGHGASLSASRLLGPLWQIPAVCKRPTSAKRRGHPAPARERPTGWLHPRFPLYCSITGDWRNG